MFEVRPICPDSLRPAYAVMQLAMPELSLGEFRRLVGHGRISEKSNAFMGIFDRRDYVHAVFRSQIELHFSAGRRLRIADLILSDSLSNGLLSLMIEGLEAYARQMRCDQMTIEAAREQPKGGIPLSDVLVVRGFSGESLLMARRI